MINNVEHIIDDNVTKAIIKYNNHPSIIKIKQEKVNTPLFKCKHTPIEIIENIIDNIDLNKASPKEGIPAKILKLNRDIFHL